MDSVKLDPVGTHLQGYVHATYDQMVAAFGPPNEPGDGYKTQAEWLLGNQTGDVVTIYDYKQGACYRGDTDGVPVKDVTEWHIGGKVPQVVAWVQQRVDDARQSTAPPSSNYAAEMLSQVNYELPGLDPPLANLYALLALTKGTATTLEDVHDAWSIWVATTRGAHKSLIPFVELATEVQELGREYVDGIHRVARSAPGSGNG
jgi:hypothetical protein